MKQFEGECLPPILISLPRFLAKYFSASIIDTGDLSTAILMANINQSIGNNQLRCSALQEIRGFELFSTVAPFNELSST